MIDLISVIVPIYNVEKYLRKCIDSIINQTYKNLEIILVDDGSPDKCPAICDEYKIKDNRIKVIHKPNGGLSDARNYGLDNITGKYVVFIDSDDYIDKNHIEVLCKLKEKYNVDLPCSNVIFEFEDGKSLPKTQFDDVIMNNNVDIMCELLNFHHGVGVAMDSRLFLSEWFDGIRFIKGALHEDLILFFELYKKINSIAITSIATYHYIQNPTSILHKCMKFENFLYISDFLEKQIVDTKDKKLKETIICHLFKSASVYADYLINANKDQEIQYFQSVLRKYLLVLLFNKDTNKKVKFWSILISINKFTIVLYIKIKKLYYEVIKRD